MTLSRPPRWDVRVPMRDGISLSADIYLSGDTPRPVVLHRTPYLNTNAMFVRQAQHFASQGFHVVIQDVRGRGDSDGLWEPFRNEGPDGYDTIEWLAAQPWCDGQVAMFGGSYSGWVQWAAARERPPHLATMISSAASGKWMHELPWRNGMFTLSSLIWLFYTAGRKLHDLDKVDWELVFNHLPVRDMPEFLGRDLPVFATWLDHPTLDDYWRPLLLTPEHFSNIDIPVLHITGNYDADQPGALFFYEGMTKHSPAREQQALVMGPWDHWGACGLPVQTLGGFDFGAASVLPVASEVHLDWFKRHLSGDSKAESSGAKFFLTGANQWSHAASWPPPSVACEFHLSAPTRQDTQLTGCLDLHPDPLLEVDVYTYDPGNPVIPVTGAEFAAQDGDREAANVTLDLGALNDRADVLVYESDPLSEPLAIAGWPRLSLIASSDCVDTDWVCALHDAAPDGRSQLLTKVGLRARFRDSFDEPTLMTPGETYTFLISFEAVGHVFLPDHRLRLTVTSSDFPACDRNLNTGGPIGDESHWLIATNTIHRGGPNGSRLTIPVIPVDR